MSLASASRIGEPEVTMHGPLLLALVSLQVFHVLFLALHDWLPLGRLNDTRAVRAQDSAGKLLLTTLLSTAPYAWLLLLSAHHLHDAIPAPLTPWLAGAYGLLFLGELRAWWFPYLSGTSPERTARYRAMFGRTHAFLPERHGITPNTLHVILHTFTLLTLVLLAVAIHTGAARILLEPRT